MLAFAEPTRTAAEAAAVLGCDPAQIAKCIVFRAGDQAILVITMGARLVDMAAVAGMLGQELQRAHPDWLREVTGFAAGGVAPIGHLSPPTTLLDGALLGAEVIWAAAGSPRHMFRTTPSELAAMTRARIARVSFDPAADQANTVRDTNQ
ncbi:MAG: YbaK/EbsC family protein [Acetobacteraceae bacterium]|nr:YbaK/EbsC family protein [Acetobacteraceae bacterium]